VLADRELEQELHFLERETEVLRALDEAQPVDGILAIPAHRAETALG